MWVVFVNRDGSGKGGSGIRPNPSRLDRGWTIRIGWWTYTGIPV